MSYKAPERFWRQRNTHPFTGLAGVLASGGAFAFLLTYTYASYRRAIQLPLPTREEIAALDTVAIWRDKEAAKYEDEIAWEEWWAGVIKKRRSLIKKAEGNVLESAAGTARNRGMYDESKVRSLTFVDQSMNMLEKAKERWWETENIKRNQKIKTRFLIGDLGRGELENALKPERTTDTEGDSAPNGEDKFDTVVQTMGLCSTPDPVTMLQNLGRIVKQDGKILLLEHGKSHYEWMNELLDRTSIHHARKHGCWWNRDIRDIVEKSGLEVEEVRRYNFGTLWWLVLKPPKEPLPPVKESLKKTTIKELETKLEPRVGKNSSLPSEY